ncbi:uncharacterized protein I206_100687 [Kwoniella pini CBS 10737]|uniref:DUF4211 domain-containing protein n=1 Tax=Kwoniella pini CBS 10737 TaxID=1296096 RepID=A0A1B9ICS6_9TREE|nr:uncharacterized protein I206_00638 [Kwoniella pini CBS 10737]OCF53336.1 hypothetical protein I206_00638 [Kwoniella pini CBS 10737]
MPPSKSKQTTLFSHFDPSSRDQNAGPSRARSTRNNQPLFDPSDSEGSEGLDHVRMKETKPDITKLPMTQRRAMKHTVFDQKEWEEQEDEEEEQIESPRKRKSTQSKIKSTKPRVKRKHRSECSDTDPDEEFISIPLEGYLFPEYRGTHSQKVRRRNERLEAVEIERANKKADILTDDEIELFPSPLSPKGRKGRLGKDKITYGKGKGKSKVINIDDEYEDDEIVAIDPPVTSHRATRANASKLTQSSETPDVNKSRNIRIHGKAKLPMKRTRSEVIVEIPKMSQENRKTYLPFSASNSSESIGQSSSNIMKNKFKPTVEIPSRSKKKSPIQKSSTPESLPPILEVEMSDNGNNDDANEDDGSYKSKPKSRSKSPVKGSSPLKRRSPNKEPSLTEEGHPTTSAAWIKQFSPVRESSPSREASKVPSSKRSSVDHAKVDSPIRQASQEAETPLRRKQVLPAAHAPFELVDTPPRQPNKGKSKGKSKAKPVSSSDEEDSMPIRRPKKPVKVVYAVKSSHPKNRNKTSKPNLKTKAKRIVDPDDDNGAETENEENMLDDLKMDEPERFKSVSRLRKRPKETATQRNIRKLKNKRLGIVESSTEEDNSSSMESDPTDSDDETATDDDSNVEDIIVPDDSTVIRAQLPHEFSSNSAQTPEFKFKVVFHYLVMIVMKGKRAFPLSSEAANYFKPQLNQFRNRMESYRDLRVASQIWRMNFKRALKKYPLFDVEELLHAEPGCDACHMGGRMSKFRVNLDGDQYNPETHQPLDSSSSEEEDSGSSDDSEAMKRKKLPKSLLMGRFCKQRAEVYHQMAHWEDTLFHRIRGYYRDLLRAKYKPVPSDSEASTPESEIESDEDSKERTQRQKNRRVRRQASQARCERLRNKTLPSDVKDVDGVTEWMDKMGYQNKEFRWIERLIDQSGQLEHSKDRDE